MAEPLNPTLYNNLERLFGRIKISNEGEATISQLNINPINGKTEVVIDHPGETYNVNCNLCSDTRFRLSIAHSWGQKDLAGGHSLWLCNCFNEHCYDSEARWKLYTRINDIASLSGAQIKPGRVIVDPGVVHPPGIITPLHELPPHHKANRYLAGRFLDPEYLSRHMGVGYCEQSFYTYAVNTIYIPVVQEGKLMTWQCRYPDDIDFKAEGAPPKYFTCPRSRRRFALHNIEQASKWHTVVVVEGVTDEFSFGPMGIAVLGYPLTPQQEELLEKYCRSRTVIFMFDPDVLKTPSTKRAWEMMRNKMAARFKGGCAFVVPPENYDPGELDGSWMRRYVTAEAAKQDVKCEWRLA